MPGSLSFKYPASALVGAVDKEPEEKNILLGEFNSTDQLSNELRFEAGAALPVPCRASVTRLVFVKLLGTGILAAVSGARATDKDVALSCAFAAAVNGVACLHYWIIWKIRAQSLHSTSPYSAFMLRVGRRADYQTEQADNAEKLFAQETSIDGLRHSDWTATLVLLILDLHGLAAHANPTGKPIVIKELGAFMQTWIIGLGSVGRFFCNECRRDSRGRWPAVGSKGFWSILVGVGTYLASFGIWLFTTINVTEHARLPANATESQELDSNVVYFISWVQVGYPLVALVSVLWLNYGAGDLRDPSRPMPGNQYSPWLSFYKDLFYGSLDVTAKGGLALYCAMRATWVQ